MMILFLSDVAGSEVLLILVFVLMFFGSKSIPGIARTMGKTMRQIRDASQELQDEIKKTTGDIKGDLNLGNLIQETKQDIQQPFEEYANDIEESIKFEQKNSYYIQKQLEEEQRKTSLPLDQQHTEE